MRFAKAARRTQSTGALSNVLTHVATVDASWQNEIVPKTTDDKIRIRVNFRIESG